MELNTQNHSRDAIDTPEFIVDVQQARNKYLFSHPSYFALFLLIIGMAILLSYIFPNLIQVWFAIALFIIALIIGSIVDKMRDSMMRQFAKSLGYKYTPDGDMKSIQGNLFTIGHSRKIFNVVIGTYKERPIRIFSYVYTIGYGKQSRRMIYSVFEYTFDTSLIPDILLCSSQMFLIDPRTLSKNLVRVSLEEEYNKYFKLYVEKEFEIEAYEIFTENFLIELVENCKMFSFEFSGDKLYICTSGFLDNREKLNKVFTLLGVLTDKIHPKVKQIKGSVEAMRDVLNNSLK